MKQEARHTLRHTPRPSMQVIFNTSYRQCQHWCLRKKNFLMTSIMISQNIYEFFTSRGLQDVVNYR